LSSQPLAHGGRLWVVAIGSVALIAFCIWRLQAPAEDSPSD
jgi:hypothetical protein